MQAAVQRTCHGKTADLGLLTGLLAHDETAQQDHQAA